MSKVVLIGSSSAIAKSLQEISNRDFICFSRENNNLDIHGDLSELDDIGSINGLVIRVSINLVSLIMFKDRFSIRSRN